MKIFISHSYNDRLIGEALVELLTGIGIKNSEIIFTSNKAYGIPGGQNIFDWLKSQILEKPCIIYLLSDDYYRSVACLNEMGASWITGNKQLALYTPNFDLNSKNFQSGALDPRAIAYSINDDDNIFSFVEYIRNDFEITSNNVLINQKIKRFLTSIQSIPQHAVKNGNLTEQVNALSTSNNHEYKKDYKVFDGMQEDTPKPVNKNPSNTIKKDNAYDKLKDLLISKKLKDEEIILLYYAIDRSKFKLMTGWQEDNEIRNIKTWEEVNNIKNQLSKNYSSTLERFRLRGFIDVSDVTSHGNPKELSFVDDIINNLLDTDSETLEIIKRCIDSNYFDYSSKESDDDDGLPF